jgi:hypothetical protein
LTDDVFITRGSHVPARGPLNAHYPISWGPCPWHQKAVTKKTSCLMILSASVQIAPCALARLRSRPCCEQSASVGRPLVLIVDAHENSRDGALLLELNGYCTWSVDSVTQAIECVFHWRPAAIITDIALPHVNGWVLVRATIPSTRNTPIRY